MTDMTSTVQRLTRTPGSRLDRVQLLLEHRTAQKRFRDQCKISSNRIEVLFPRLAKTRAVVQAAVSTKASLGNVMANELIILSTVCAHLQPKLVFEFGTYDGLTTLHFAINSPDDARVMTIDLHPDDPLRQTTTDDTFYTKGVQVGAHFQDASEAGKIEQIYADTTKYDYSALRGRVDLIFIDAGHDYELVKSDSQKALEMIRPGGAIFWHDYHYAHSGVYTYLNELAPSRQLISISGATLVCHVSPE